MKKKRYISMFTKSVVSFAIIGIIPMLLMGFSIYKEYSEKVAESLLINANQISEYTEKNIRELLEEADEYTKYLYNYNISEFDYFYQIILNDEITDTKREMLINDILRSILYRNEYLKHVFFIDSNNVVYSEKRISEKKMYQSRILKFHRDAYDKENKDIYYIAPHTMKYCADSNGLTLTAARNIYNTKTVEKASKEILGTIYLDMDTCFLDELVGHTTSNLEQDVYLIRKASGEILYFKDRSVIGTIYDEYAKDITRYAGKSGIVETSGRYMIYREITGTDWILLNDLSKIAINKPYYTIQRNTILLICMEGLLLGIIYFFYATRTARPMRDLMHTMGLIQKGDLSAKARITTHDEIAVIAGGLNEMTKKLENHINQVYVAQIKQRDAQMDALRMQIQPHYLYNTLDVIRMSALTNEDFSTAEMLNSLSFQLKYAISTTKDMVPLKVEVESILNYFKLVEIRFENRYELEIQIPEELLKFEVPKIILQPSVENAIKHGFRGREGKGEIQITAQNRDNELLITIMDNGVGMPEDRLKEIQKLLKSEDMGRRSGDNWENVGIKNVHDRIRLMFGERYGIMIDSFEGIGTIVKYRIPLIGTEPEGIEKDV